MIHPLQIYGSSRIDLSVSREKTAEGDFLPPFEIGFPRSLRNGLAVAHERHLAHQISRIGELVDDDST